MQSSRTTTPARTGALRAARGGVPVRVETGRGEPRLPAGWLLVRPLRVALSPEDARASSLWSGVLGSRFVGVVERVGEGAPARRVGTRIVATPALACGECATCRGGLASHCPSRRVLGLDGLDGALADLVAIPAGAAAEVPRAVPDARAVWSVEAGHALHAARLARAGAFVSVLGDGDDAMLLAQVLATRGTPVRVLGARPSRLELCAKWGLRSRDLGEAGRRHDQDTVFVAMGDAGALDAALGLVRPRGRVVLMGSPAGWRAGQTGWAGASLASAASDEVEVLGCAGGSVREGLDALGAGAFETAAMDGPRVGLDEAPPFLSVDPPLTAFVEP